MNQKEVGKMGYWETVITSILTSSAFWGLLIWRIKKSIQYEYDVKLEGFKAGYQKVLDENRIAFSWWHNAQAKAIQETYSCIAELSFCIDTKLRCAEQHADCSKCSAQVTESYKKAKKIWEVNKVFFDEALNQKLAEIFSISWDIKSTVNQTNACFHQRQNLLEHCRQNKSQIDTLLVELRKELRTIMSGGKTNE